MAIIILNPLLDSIRGRMGNVVFYTRLNKQCVRAHIVLRNPDTAAQRSVRRTFADAVKSWQALSDEEKYVFTGKARNLRMSGYNLYISGYMTANKRTALIPGIKLIPSRYYPYVDFLRFPSVSYPFMQSITPKTDNFYPIPP
ncbi:MAG: hypothetical protein JXN64_01205 [Spirochaetes bacterium]|nr:hypothetical protein [Spirochaetota bacterium]